MNRIAKFEKVSIGQFTAAWKDTFQERSEEKIREIYETLKLPQRATAGSAGYDFFAPEIWFLHRERRSRFLQECVYGWSRTGY